MIFLLLALQIDVRVDAWNTPLSGSMKFDEKPAAGDRLDVDADSKWMPGIAVAAAFGSERVTLSGRRLLWESEGVLEGDRRWNESSYSAGETVNGRIDLFEGELSWRHRFEGDFEISPGAGLRYLRLEAVLSSDSQGRDDDHSIVLAPAGGVDVRWRPDPRVGLAAEVEVTWLGLSDWEVSGVEASVSVDWAPSPAFGLRVGWRSESLRLIKDTSKERNDFRGEMRGPFVGVEIRL